MGNPAVERPRHKLYTASSSVLRSFRLFRVPLLLLSKCCGPLPCFHLSRPFFGRLFIFASAADMAKLMAHGTAIDIPGFTKYGGIEKCDFVLEFGYGEVRFRMVRFALN